MAEWSLDREYQRLLEDSLARGEVSVRSDGSEARSAPRFRVHDGRIVVRVEPEFALVDVSASGLAFLSEIPFKPGMRLAVIVKGVLAFQVLVLTCPMMEVDSLLMDVRYRVQCRFDNATDGKQLVLLLKEFERNGIADDGRPTPTEP